MKSYLTSIFFFLLLLISCGGSKTNLNDSLLTGTVNQNNNTTQVNTNNQGNSSTIQTPSYSFGNELVWSDEFDEDSSFGIQAVSPDKWNIETVAPDNGSWYNGELQYYTDKQDNIKVEVPSWRSDVALEEDLIEELIRIKGFNNIKLIEPEKKRTQETLNFKQKLFHLSQRSLAFFKISASLGAVPPKLLKVVSLRYLPSSMYF